MERGVKGVPLALVLALAPAAGEAAAAGYEELTVDRAEVVIRERGGGPELVVLDIRTPQEFAAGHLPHAVNIDFRAPGFAEALAALRRDTTTLVYCRTGNRSSHALPLLRRLGFGSVLHLTEGINGWVRRGLPVERPARSPAP